MGTATLEKFNVLNRWTNDVQFTAEISVTPDMLPSVKLGLAIRWAVDNSAYLSDANLSDVKECVDHCHSTGRVRGLLCSDCNLALGQVRDNSSTLLRLAEYIQRAEAEAY